MNAEKFSEAMNGLDCTYVEKAIHYQAPKRKKVQIKWMSMAACFSLILVISITAVFQFQRGADPNITPGPNNGVLDHSTFPSSTISTSVAGNYPFVSMGMQADWPYYSSAAKVVGAATHIYRGIITDISFAVIDQSTGLVDHAPESSSNYRMLYTVYTIVIGDQFKGESPAEVKLCIAGGLVGYKEDAQYELMCETGLLSKYQGIPITTEQSGTLALDTDYLFCISRTGDFDYIINPTQFVYSFDSDNCQNIIDACK